MRYHFPQIVFTKIKTFSDILCELRCREMEILGHFSWECKLVQLPLGQLGTTYKELKCPYPLAQQFYFQEFILWIFCI